MKIFSLEKSCNDIQEYNGFYVLKYTFVKFTGECLLYDERGYLVEQRSYENGEKNGKFLTFRNRKVLEIYHMKDNELDGLFESFRNEKPVKRINYNDGELIDCEISLSETMSREKELIILQKKYLKEKNNNRLKEKIIILDKGLLTDKESCEIKEIIK